ncbi:unnamed protein product [Haemonchus placei]|uniref:Uncharacterized protein n=1 Tax=Haemonchus placei TaxID=6290 RepID=A0A0N4X7P5_HAEPC|nr:unnamed protein product [Haemonchus placei]
MGRPGIREITDWTRLIHGTGLRNGILHYARMMSLSVAVGVSFLLSAVDKACHLMKGHSEHRSNAWRPEEVYRTCVQALEGRCSRRSKLIHEQKLAVKEFIAKVEIILLNELGRSLEAANEPDRRLISRLNRVCVGIIDCALINNLVFLLRLSHHTIPMILESIMCRRHLDPHGRLGIWTKKTQSGQR